jgi:superfamily II DNA or RNA helicase
MRAKENAETIPSMLNDDGRESPAPTFKLRSYQKQWADAIDKDRAEGFTRLVIDASGGLGKSTLFAYIAKLEWERHGKRTLVLANRERLVLQSAKRMRDETGLDVDVEMGDQTASPFTPIVMASIQSISRKNRLLSYSPDHFSVVVPDECHHAGSPSFQRVLNYFHYGADSLNENWERPKDGEYVPIATIIGTTATPPAEGKKNHLGKFFQKYSARYSYLSAVEDGWLVKPVLKTIPVKIDTSKFRISRTSHGRDFADYEVNEAIMQVVPKLIDQVVLHASDRKTMCFWPSVECAKIAHEVTLQKGLYSIFVSGECDDADDRATAFDNAGAGTVMNLCSIYVEGIDFIAVSAIGWFRVTMSEEWYKQGIFRGTRTLKGIVDDSMTKEERREAIALSGKPDLLILDPAANHERLDICSIYDLFTDVPEIKERMKAMDPNKDLGEAAKEAERDFLKSLKRELKKQERREARTINPLAWAMSLGDPLLASYQPENDRDSLPPTPGQIDFMRRQHIDTDKIKYRGLATKLIGRILTRIRMGLATPGQLDFLHNLGVSDEQAALLTHSEASATIDLLKNHPRPKATVTNDDWD